MHSLPLRLMFRRCLGTSSKEFYSQGRFLGSGANVGRNFCSAIS